MNGAFGLEMAGTAVPYFGDAVTASFENTGPVIQTVLDNIEVMLSDVPDDGIFVLPIAVDDSDTPIEDLVVTATSPHIPTNRIGFADGDGRIRSLEIDTRNQEFECTVTIRVVDSAGIFCPTELLCSDVGTSPSPSPAALSVAGPTPLAVPLPGALPGPLPAACAEAQRGTASTGNLVSVENSAR